MKLIQKLAAAFLAAAMALFAVTVAAEEFAVPQVVELVGPAEFLVHDGDGYVVGRVTGLKVTAVQGSAPNTTAWALTFDIKNDTWSTENDVALYVDFLTANNFPLPAPSNRLAVGKWRNGCFYGPEGQKRYDCATTISVSA